MLNFLGFKNKNITLSNKLKVLFILKRREDYSSELVNNNYSSVATGMWNSSRFMVKMLQDLGVTTNLVMVTDNNDIDREVTNFDATHVFIEGLWVVPSKFYVLKNLHPQVKWIVRIHSDTPFLSQEGIAIDWITKYLYANIYVAANSPRMYGELLNYCKEFSFYRIRLLSILPNYYPTESAKISVKKPSNLLDVACFGAIRPLKNQLIQAMAISKYCAEHNLYLRFHINSNRIEGNAQSVLKNLRSYFSNQLNSILIEHNWTDHDKFLDELSNMDLSLQVSFSETFNIVTADALVSGVPVVVSKEIPYAVDGIADPTSSNDICNKIKYVLQHKNRNIKRNLNELANYNKQSIRLWKEFLQ